MNYLAIDTSADHLTVIVKIGEKIATSFIKESGTRHSEQLMPEVEKCLRALGVSVHDIDVFCAVTGPGSFTGIRIGVATVKGFADATKKKVLGVTAFDVIAYNVKSGKTLAVIDAKHDHYYVCGYEAGIVVLSPRYVDKNTLNGLIEGFLPVCYAPIEGFDFKTVSPLSGLMNAVEANACNASDNVNDLTPFYLRLSQAEEGRK
ncbi:MAG: tRNA (adenosine(37)-N6)-threonylcarbamoyltransferase complex dimerization subunit type 1 TsaB [Clostridia bacterium]|nr:tRNA (adenosine(37)-N6)-threonylcarbamoyltransferase complex dimerization subunit type 1 TsaB [Clostridia bacterium]